MQDGVAALAHHNYAGLHLVGHMNNLLGWMAGNNFRLEFDSLLFGKFPSRDIALFMFPPKK
jgi:hypothetical protein